MEELVDVIAISSNHNDVRPGLGTTGKRSLTASLNQSKALITIFQHFRFASSSPGVVFVREAVDAPEKEVRLLKAGVSVADVEAAPLPEVLHDAGLSTKRKEYLYKEVREFVAEGREDVLCSCPEKDLSEQTEAGTIDCAITNAFNSRPAGCCRWADRRF